MKKNNVLDFLTELNNSKIVYMTPTRYNNTQAIKASFVYWRTNLTDIEIIIDQLKKNS